MAANDRFRLVRARVIGTHGHESAAAAHCLGVVLRVRFRHAGIRQATLRVWADGVALNLQIEDRGKGFDPDGVVAASDTSGMAGMRERAMLLGGQLTIESHPGSGTCLTAELKIVDESTGTEKPLDASLAYEE